MNEWLNKTIKFHKFKLVNMPLGKYIFKKLGPVACNTPQIDLHTQYNPYQNPG